MENKPFTASLDLFGDVAVTLGDVELWLDKVPKLPRTSPRREYYAKTWNVVNKIKAAKLSGDFYELLNDEPERPLQLEYFAPDPVPPKAAPPSRLAAALNVRR